MIRPEERSILKAFIPPFVLLALMWLVKGIEIRYGLDFYQYGIFPREPEALKGIITMPFIHADLKHIFSNSIPFLILGACMIYFYNTLYKKVFLMIWLLQGAWLWLGGREAWHIGASGVVYGMASFVLLSGLLRKERRLMALSLLVVFLYGGMVWGFFPFLLGVSFEAHIYGAVAGVLLAIAYRKEGPQRVKFDWEDEPETDEPAPEDLELPDQISNSEENTSSDKPASTPDVVYHYKKDDDKLDN